MVDVKQVGGDHYAQEYQAWDYIINHKIEFLLGNIIKYCTRYDKKNGLQDIDKAKSYFDKFVGSYDINLLTSFALNDSRYLFEVEYTTKHIVFKEQYENNSVKNIIDIAYWLNSFIQEKTTTKVDCAYQLISKINAMYEAIEQLRREYKDKLNNKHSLFC